MSMSTIRNQTHLNSLPDKGRQDFLIKNRTGLIVRRYANGSLVFTARVMTKGKRVMVTLGNTSDITIAEASAKRDLLKKGYASSVEEANERKLVLADVIDEYHQKRTARLKAANQVHDIFRRFIAPMLGETPLNQITKGHLFSSLEDIKFLNGRENARKTLCYLRLFFQWSLAKDFVAVNPAALVDSKMLDVEKGEPRSRTLSPEEIVSFFAAVDAAGNSETVKIGLRLVLLTGMRSGELLKSNVSNFNAAKQTLSLPAELCKNGAKRTVYLSTQATALMKRLAQLSQKGFLMEGKFGNQLGPTSLIQAISRLQTSKTDKPPQLILDAHLTVHDLRRTFATCMSKLGVDYHICELALGHSLPKLVRTYNVTDRPDEQREAVQKLADVLDDPMSNFPREDF